MTIVEWFGNNALYAGVTLTLCGIWVAALHGLTALFGRVPENSRFGFLNRNADAVALLTVFVAAVAFFLWAISL